MVFVIFFLPLPIFFSLTCQQQLGESKIASMMESKDFRKGIIQLEWYAVNVDS